jgi:cytoskeletal protein CcmA (bactofilin family)
VVAGDVGGDVVVVGGLLKILSTANIKGDVLFFGGELQVLGNVDGSVMGTAEQARIDALIGKSVDMKVGTLTLGDNAEILGDVRYTSIGEIVRSQNAVVVGEIVKNTAPVEKEVSYEMYVVSFIVILFSALILQLLFRTQLLKSIPALTHNLGAAGLVGMASLILIPIVVVISLASMLGMLVGLIMLFAFILLILISCALSSILVGVILQKYINGTESLNVAYTIFGAVILQISLVIPVLGFIVVTLIFLITFGTLIRSLYFAATA